MNLNYQKLAFNSSDKLELHEQRGAGDSNGLRTVDQVFRDPAAWMHVVWVYDSGNATECFGVRKSNGGVSKKASTLDQRPRKSS